MNLSKTKNCHLIINGFGYRLVGLRKCRHRPSRQHPGVDRIGPSTVGGVVDIIRQVGRWVYIIFFIIAVLLSYFRAFILLRAGETRKSE